MPSVIDPQPINPLSLSNIKRFIAFRLLFNARFYYPVFTIIFLDFGLSLEQFALLNVIWAATIVGLEVPSGALADTIGRRNLVVLAAGLMIVEIALIAFAPIGGSPLVFTLFAANRILSGAAEAAASGADEALAYDSLKDLGIEDQWGKVLERQMRFQSIAFVIAMSLGAVMYDYEKLNLVFNFLGLGFEVSQDIAMRLPLFGTLGLGIAAFFTTLGMKETKQSASSTEENSSVGEAFSKTISAGKWIWKTPAALTIILCGLFFDHIIRMVLTLTSEFYRQVALPEFSFGFIGSGLALLGIFMPKLGAYLAKNRSKGFNFLVLCTSVLIGLFLMSKFTPYWSALPMVLVYGGIFVNGFLVSHYLNEVTDSDHRATVLSFKGLSFNLAYGVFGYAYAAAISSLRKGNTEMVAISEDFEGFLFREVFSWFPAYFAIGAATVALLCIGLVKTKRWNDEAN